MPWHQLLDTLLLTVSLIRHLITDKTNCWPQHTLEATELCAVTMNILVITTKSCFSPFIKMKSTPAFLHVKMKSLVYCLSQHQCYPSLKSIKFKKKKLSTRHTQQHKVKDAEDYTGHNNHLFQRQLDASLCQATCISDVVNKAGTWQNYQIRHEPAVSHSSLVKSEPTRKSLNLKQNSTVLFV